jgi:hypothetical protein
MSDTVFFKKKYITQPIFTPADIITKALNDLTSALKEKNNDEGIRQLEALKRLDAILNNVPEPVQTQEDTRSTQRIVTLDETTNAPVEVVSTRSTQRRVTFDDTKNAPAEVEEREAIPTPRVIERPQRQRTRPIHTAII